MLLKPKFSKFSKSHKGRVSSVFKIHQQLVKGAFAIVALQPSRLTAAQIAAIDLTLKRAVKKEGELFWRVFPHTPASAKPAEVRMGKGKGSNEYWYTRIQPGAIIVELVCNNHNLAYLSLLSVRSKFPFKTYITS